ARASEQLARRALGLALDPTLDLEQAAATLLALAKADPDALERARQQLRSASPSGPIADKAQRALARAARIASAAPMPLEPEPDPSDGDDEPGPLRLVFISPPGAGKGTQSARLAELLGIVHISTGDLLRDSTHLDVRARSFLLSGRLVPDSIMLELLAAHLKRDDARIRGFILDGFPRTFDQAVALERLIAPDRIDHVIELTVDVDTARPRLHRRARDDDTPSTIARRFAHYEREVHAIS